MSRNLSNYWYDGFEGVPDEAALIQQEPVNTDKRYITQQDKTAIYKVLPVGEVGTVVFANGREGAVEIE